jgi:hypothetical protein
MSCPSCGTSNQAEFLSEMLVHFTGRENLGKPSIWVFPTLLVCLDCGLFQSTIPLYELEQLAAGVLDSSGGRESDDITHFRSHQD